MNLRKRIAKNRVAFKKTIDDPMSFMKPKTTRAVMLITLATLPVSLFVGMPALPFMIFRTLMKRSARRGNPEMSNAFAKGLGIKPKVEEISEDPRYSNLFEIERVKNNPFNKGYVFAKTLAGAGG